jgi:hypothetical protein
MWKCKTCDKVNTDTFEVCWGCYTPKKDNYIELKTGVDALLINISDKNIKTKPKIMIDNRFIPFIVSNIPFVLLYSMLLLNAIGFNGEGKGKGGNLIPLIIILLIYGVFWFISLKLIFTKKKKGRMLGLIVYPLTGLISGVFLYFGYILCCEIFTLYGYIGLLCGFYCIFFLMFDYPDLIEK